MSSQLVALRLTHLSKSFGRIRAVDDLSLEVRPGEMVGFLGPNGAGKSTTLYMIAGLVAPSAGGIEIFGHDLRRQFPQAVAHAGVMIENPALYDYLSGRHNLELAARLKGGIRPGQVDEVLRQVGLYDRRHDKAGTYSQGMKQRLGLGLTLLGEPRLLVLDEPTSSLDPEATRDILTFLRRKTRECGWAVFLSSHLLYEVQEFCDRVIVVHKGRLIAAGAVSELLAPRTDLLRVTFAGPVPGGEFLRTLDGAAVIDAVSPGTLEFHLDGRDAGWLNARLLQAGYVVTALVPRQRTLRDFFLTVTGERINGDSDAAPAAQRVD